MPRRPSRRRLVLCAAGVVALGAIAFALASRRRAPSAAVRQATLAQLLEHLSAGEVTDVAVGSDTWSVRLRDVASTLSITVPPQLLRLYRRQLQPALRGVHVFAAPRGWLDAAPTVLIALLPIVYIGVMAAVLERMQNPRESGTARRADVADASLPSFDDVQGIDAAKLELMEITDFLRAPARYEAAGATLPRGVLLAGPCGTGKTMLARAMAREAGVPFVYCCAAEFVEMLVGRGAARVRGVFQRARSLAPCILFIDEIDAVGMARGGTNSHDEREQTLDQLLSELDGFASGAPVVVIAATNRPRCLDAALVRPGRFDRHVSVPLPDARGRLAILRVHVRRLHVAGDVDLGLVASACVDFSGAELRAVAVRAQPTHCVCARTRALVALQAYAVRAYAAQNEAAIAAVRQGAPAVTRACFEGAVAKMAAARSATEPAARQLQPRSVAS